MKVILDNDGLFYNKVTTKLAFVMNELIRIYRICNLCRNIIRFLFENITVWEVIKSSYICIVLKINPKAITGC